MASPPLPKYHRIELALADRIREGGYASEGLPGERELARQFGAARVTIRSALQRLQDQGLVVRRQRQGTLVAAGPDAAAPRIRREYVDAFLDRGRKDRRKVLRIGYLPAPPEVAQALDLPTGEQVLRAVRLRSDAAGTLTYTEAWVRREYAHAVTRAALERKAFMQLLEDAGLRVAVAEQTAVAEGAPLPVSQALDIPLQAPVLRMARLLRDEREQPVQWMLAWFRADRFELRMQLSKAEDATKVWLAVRG
jgi:GntR family transcriptional regulator